MWENTVTSLRRSVSGFNTGDGSKSFPKVFGKNDSGFIPSALEMQTIRIGGPEEAAAPIDSREGKAIETPAAFRNSLRDAEGRNDRWLCGFII